MNKRIKDMMGDATIHEHGQITKFDTNLFAKLIVQECVKISLKASARDDDMGAIIAKHINEHFGIA